VAPGLFGVDASGSGPAAAYVLPGSQFTFACASAYNCADTPVNVGSGATYLILFGTGVEYHVNPVIVEITGQNGNPLASPTASYAGAQGSYAGLDQINVLLPASLAGSGVVKVSLLVDGMASNTVQIQIQ
jgi:uncharacterized protein (TIGR03437 family)